MLLISWLPPLEPNGVLLSYTVYCKVLAAGSGDFSGGSSESGNFLSPMPVHSMAVSSSTTQLRFSGLMPYTAYECYVTGTTSAGEGNYTTVSTASTDEAGKLCLFVENIIFGSCYYCFKMLFLHSLHLYIKMYSASLYIRYILYNHCINQHYQLHLLYPTTEPGDPPANLVATVTSATSILLTWSEPLLPNGVLVSYNITYNLTGISTSIIVSADNTAYTVSGLNAFVYYQFLVSASTRVGAGPVATTMMRTNEAGK